MISKENKKNTHVAYFLISLNCIFFLQTKNTIGIDGADFNYKILAFFSDALFHDAFNPELISINGLWQNILGHLIFAKELIPTNYAKAVQIYQGTLFIPFTILVILIVRHSEKNLIPSLIFLSAAMMPGRDIWFAYHLDKYFSFFCLFLFFYMSNELEKKENKLNFFIMTAGILSYPITVLIYFYASIIKLCNSSKVNKTTNVINFLFLTFLIIAIKHLSSGENTYLNFDPLANNYRIPHLASFFYTNLDFNLNRIENFLLSIIFLNLFFIINKLNPSLIISKMTKSLITLFVICAGVILINIFLKRIGYNVPIWQFISIQISAFWLLISVWVNYVVYKILEKKIKRYFLKIKLVRICYLNISLLSVILILLFFKSALYNGAMRNSAEQEAEMQKKIEGIEVIYSENKKCIESKNLGPFGTVYVKLKYNEIRMLPFSHDFSNPKSQTEKACESY
jgi:hypothetical protein